MNDEIMAKIDKIGDASEKVTEEYRARNPITDEDQEDDERHVALLQQVENPFAHLVLSSFPCVEAVREWLESAYLREAVGALGGAIDGNEKGSVSIIEGGIFNTVNEELGRIILSKASHVKYMQFMVPRSEKTNFQNAFETLRMTGLNTAPGSLITGDWKLDLPTSLPMEPWSNIENADEFVIFVCPGIDTHNDRIAASIVNVLTENLASSRQPFDLRAYTYNSGFDQHCCS